MPTIKKNNYYYALGRRKSAVARVRLSSGKGLMVVNEKPLSEYLGGSTSLQAKALSPFSILEIESGKFNLSVKIAGGGQSSQSEAVALGIAKALASLNEDYRGSLKRAGLLGRDPRAKERKKFGLRSARKKRQFTKR